MSIKLNWKTKWLDDGSGYWLQADVPVIGWEYVVDNGDANFFAAVFLGPSCSDATRIEKRVFKHEKTAMRACERHLAKSVERFARALKLSNKFTKGTTKRK
jgi:hypothetical protein